jgi:hypothetical protein
VLSEGIVNEANRKLSAWLPSPTGKPGPSFPINNPAIVNLMNMFNFPQLTGSGLNPARRRGKTLRRDAYRVPP